ncbi:MAG: hypothetical protein DRN12_03715 [Thermoplasmata archaeon]|nr:MAG: hypothetical protein DRN12_03715 [Thermoplasmata archaeon]HEC89845.1 hydrogenase maturation protease [Thermoplasmatales archaeon]
MNKTIIIGVGNPILGDDAVGIEVVKNLRNKISNPSIDIVEAYTGGFNLLDMFIGYEKAIIIDAIVSADSAGEVKKINLNELPKNHSWNPHAVSLYEALRLAEKLGEDRIPKEIIVLAVMIPSIQLEFREGLSSIVREAIPKAIDETLREVNN